MDQLKLTSTYYEPLAQLFAYLTFSLNLSFTKYPEVIFTVCSFPIRYVLPSCSLCLPLTMMRLPTPVLHKGVADMLDWSQDVFDHHITSYQQPACQRIHNTHVWSALPCHNVGCTVMTFDNLN